MLSYLLVNSVWTNQKFELTTRHHLEQTQLLKQEEVIWRALEQMHREQRIQLGKRPFNILATADLIEEQTRSISGWHTNKRLNRQTMKVRQDAETATLEQERGA